MSASNREPRWYPDLVNLDDVGDGEGLEPEVPPKPEGDEVCAGCGKPAVCYGAENDDAPSFCCAECGGLVRLGATELPDLEAGVVYPLECGWFVMLPHADALAKAARCEVLS